MNFEDWQKKNHGRFYADILQEVFQFDDPAFFSAWAKGQRLNGFIANDWGMLAVTLLSERISELEKKKKDKD